MMEWIPKGIQIWIITTLLLETFLCAPLEDREIPRYQLELQSSLSDNYNDAKDSYGNPIQYSDTIDTPDGRKVVSAKGVQFEIPDYASGITNIRRPSDDLLPPSLGESNDFEITEDNTFSESSLSYQSQAPPQLLKLTRAPIKTQAPIQNQPTSKFKTPPPLSKYPQEQNAKYDKHSRNNFPLSSGNFNYANIPKDQSIINKIASKYQNPIPTLEPIAVAIPDDSEAAASSDTLQGQSLNIQQEVSSSTENNGRYTGGFGGPPGLLGLQSKVGTYYQNQIATAQEINNIPITPVVESSSDTSPISEPIPMIPDWLADYKDPNLGPPVPYNPSEMGQALNVLSWGLVPPDVGDVSNRGDIDNNQEQQNKFGSADNGLVQKFSLFNNGQQTQISPNLTPSTVSTTLKTTTTTPRPTTTRTTPKPTTRPTTTKTTTTTTSTTTTPTTTTRTTPSSTTKSIFDELLVLENGNTGNLPEWLIDFNDPDVGSAVDFVIPDDLNNYNHTIVRSLLPPLASFEELKVINISPPQKPSVPSTDKQIRPQKINVQIETQKTNLITTLPTNAKPQSFTEINTNTQQQLASAALTTQAAPIPSTNPIKAVTKPADPKIQSTTAQITSTTVTPPAISPSTSAATPPPPSPQISDSEIFENPFVPTIPPWLIDLNDPDVGPGVPFIYTNAESTGFKYGLSPPDQSVPQTSFNQNQSDPNFNLRPFPEKVSVSLPVTDSPEQTISSTLSSDNKLQPAKIFTPPLTVTVTESNKSEQQSPPTPPTATEPSRFNTISGQTNSLFNNKGGFTNTKSFLSNSIFPTQPTQRPSVFSQSTSSFASRFPTQQTLTTKANFGKPFGSINGFTSFPSSFGNKFDTSLKPRPTTSIPNNNDSGKYTGGFGGAPGLLGQQLVPGFAIRPDGSINDPDHTYRPPVGGVAPVPVTAFISTTTSAPPIPVNTPTQSNNNYQKYTGGFGGPPGLLVPFDNVKS